jgi:hypothetical protein
MIFVQALFFPQQDPCNGKKTGSYRLGLTPTLHRYFYFFMSGIRKTFFFTATMLDAGYLMPDVLDFPISMIEKHPVCRLT